MTASFGIGRRRPGIATGGQRDPALGGRPATEGRRAAVAKPRRVTNVGSPGWAARTRGWARDRICWRLAAGESLRTVVQQGRRWVPRLVGIGEGLEQDGIKISVLRVDQWVPTNTWTTPPL